MDFLESSGELPNLIRGRDWSASLGPIERWPQALRIVLRILLTSRYAMWMGWGPDLTVFYNDAYARMTLGKKHPWALGRPAREVWAEIWPQIGPRIERVLSTGEATWDEGLMLFLERSGYREETYHTFSYSPLADDRGAICGHFCVVTEETNRIIGERRLAMLRELAAHLASAKTTTDVYAAIARCLATDSRDMPFTLAFSDGGAPHLVGATNIATEHPGASPDAWPLERALHEAVLVDLRRDVAWPTGPWADPPTKALVMPIADQAHGASGVLVAALSPYRALDDAYRSFLNLFVGQVAAGLANARAFEEEKRRAEALAEIDRAKTAFFSNVSHEFRTPLTLMLGQTEDALGTPERALAGEALESVHRNELRLLKLVNALLDFARMEAGRAQPAFEATDLATLTRDLASSFRAAIERAGLVFDVDVATSPSPMLVDRDMWEKIVFNLLSNALKFTLEGRIGVRLRFDDGGALLEVSDTGTGIPPEEQPRVFDRFHRVQTARARSHEGSGIGLALVRELARVHGGDASVESTLGKGTTFTVRLPRANASATAQASTTRNREGRAYVEEAARWMEAPREATSTDGPVVLLADDNADMRDYVARVLGARFRVRAVSNGRAALESAREEPPALVLTDVMMPELDGFGLLRALRADERTRHVPVIMLSARAGEEARVQGVEAGADDYLVKPFSARELVARVALHVQLAQLRAAAETERAKLRATFEQAPFPIAVYEGLDHRVVLTNDRWAQVMGRALPVGVPLAKAMPQVVDQGILDWHDRAARGERVVVRDYAVDLDVGGEKRRQYFHVVLQPLRDADGAVYGHVTMALDVTEQVDANRAKDEFLAMLGHELRNPLSPMLTALQLLRLQGKTSREHEILERQVAHLTRLVDDLLDVSRITRGKIELRKRATDLADVVARAVEIASPLLEQRRHRLELAVTRGIVANVDADRLAQVIANLLTNAAKYSDAQSRIRVAVDRAGANARIRVEDNGVGIESAMQGRIFDMFVQRPQTIERSQGGLGLGLTIVKSLTELHGGTVRVESDGVGHGSVFTIELPALETEARSATSPPSHDPSRTPTRARVLVVDDNVDAAEMLAAVLEQMNYEVVTANDGVQALAALERFTPQIALVDIGLPVMNGYELAPRLRALTPQLKLVAVTGYGQEDDRKRSRAAGFDDHLVKPVDFGQLQATLARYDA